MLPHLLLQEMCENWFTAGECEGNKGFMEGHCRKSCKLCQPRNYYAEQEAGFQSDIGEVTTSVGIEGLTVADVHGIVGSSSSSSSTKGSISSSCSSGISSSGSSDSGSSSETDIDRTCTV